jgi:hypothetical protein
MLSRFSRSWELIKASGRVLAADKELLVLPVLSALAGMAIIASFLFPALIDGWLRQAVRAGQEQGQMDPLVYAWIFSLYVALYFVGFFFNTALVAAALERLRGGDPTLGSALGAAAERFWAILGYAIIAATVGLILRAIEERVGWVGKIVVGLIGAVWTIATFLAVPVLVAQNVGPIEAVKQSATLLKKTWGENLIGQGGIGIGFFLLYLLTTFLFIGLTVLAAKAGGGPAVGVLVALYVVAMIVLATVHAALAAIYSAALYRFAAEGDAGSAFGAQTLSAAFQPKLIS